MAGAGITLSDGFGTAFMVGAGIFVATAVTGVVALPGRLGADPSSGPAPGRQAPAPTTTPR